MSRTESLNGHKVNQKSQKNQWSSEYSNHFVISLRIVLNLKALVRRTFGENTQAAVDVHLNIFFLEKLPSCKNLQQV